MLRVSKLRIVAALGVLTFGLAHCGGSQKAADTPSNGAAPSSEPPPTTPMDNDAGAVTVEPQTSSQSAARAASDRM